MVRTEKNKIGVEYMFVSSRMGSTGKESSCNVETWIQYLGWEDALEEGMATHSTILAWRIPRTEEPGGLQSMGSKGVKHN